MFHKKIKFLIFRNDQEIIKSKSMSSSKKQLHQSTRKSLSWRILEIIPGFLTWFTLLFPLTCSIYHPQAIAYFAIFYAVLWLFRSFKLSFYLLISYRKFKREQGIDWQKKISSLAREDIPSPYLASKNIVHFVVLITYKEEEEVLRDSIKSYVESNIDTKRKLRFILAIEEADQKNGEKIFCNLKKEFSPYFYDFHLTVHPKNVPGEIPGKSSNINYAAREIKKIIDREKISYDRVLLSNFDADTVVHDQYFSELEYRYLTQKNRTKKAYQPVHLYHNNIWDVPAVVRIVALSGSFWRMAESQQISKYRSFSSRSNSFANLVDLDFWDPSIIPEDSRQYWTGYFKYKGDFKLTSLSSPLYMDAVSSQGYFTTLKSQYIQIRRWAWGVSDFPFVTLNSIRSGIPLWKKVKVIWELLENNLFWATAPFLITFLGWIPSLINSSFRQSVLAYRLPDVLSQILTLSSIGLLLCASFTILILPRNEQNKGFFAYPKMFFQWVLIPFVSIFFSAMPAIDAQTRLMLSKDLSYKVTDKFRKR